MTWTQCEKQAYEAIASEVYGKQVIFQPRNYVLEIPFEEGFSGTFETGLILFGTLTVGLGDVSAIEGVKLFQSAPTIRRVQTFRFESTAFGSAPFQLKEILFDGLEWQNVVAINDVLYWNFTGYACKLT